MQGSSVGSMSWKYIGGFRACPIVAKLGVPTSK
jgi:hypothetical protein